MHLKTKTSGNVNRETKFDTADYDEWCQRWKLLRTNRACGGCRCWSSRVWSWGRGPKSPNRPRPALRMKSRAGWGRRRLVGGRPSRCWWWATKRTPPANSPSRDAAWPPRVSWQRHEPTPGPQSHRKQIIQIGATECVRVNEWAKCRSARERESVHSLSPASTVSHTHWTDGGRSMSARRRLLAACLPAYTWPPAAAPLSERDLKHRPRSMAKTQHQEWKSKAMAKVKAWFTFGITYTYNVRWMIFFIFVPTQLYPYLSNTL